MDLTNPFRHRPARLACLPRIVRLYILNCFLGFMLAAVFTGLVLWLNIGNIGHLVAHVSGGWLAGLVFFGLNGIVFAGVQSAIVVMSLGRREPPSGGHGRPIDAVPVPALSPRAKARARRD